MKRKHEIGGNGEHIQKLRKTLLSSSLQQTVVTLSHHNKSRGILRIQDNALKCFFAEFVTVAKTPLHFYVVTKPTEKQTTIQSKFKVIPDSFIRMVACILVHCRQVLVFHHMEFCNCNLTCLSSAA